MHFLAEPRNAALLVLVLVLLFNGRSVVRFVHGVWALYQVTKLLPKMAQSELRPWMPHPIKGGVHTVSGIHVMNDVTVVRLEGYGYRSFHLSTVFPSGDYLSLREGARVYVTSLGIVQQLYRSPDPIKQDKIRDFNW